MLSIFLQTYCSFFSLRMPKSHLSHILHMSSLEMHLIILLHNIHLTNLFHKKNSTFKHIKLCGETWNVLKMKYFFNLTLPFCTKFILHFTFASHFAQHQFKSEVQFTNLNLWDFKTKIGSPHPNHFTLSKVMSS